jgi:hypothetical protein
MTLVEKLREITEGFGWVFHYGRRDFQNLVEADAEDDQKWYFFLDPVTRNPLYSDSGLPTGEIEYTGYFMILTKSDLDQVYDGQNDTDINEGKWQEHIKPKLDNVFGEFENALTCVDDLQIVRLSITDAINVFDENLDGILVNFKIKQY